MKCVKGSIRILHGILSRKSSKKLKEMLEKILSKENMTKAYNRVLSNQGCAGIDKMSVYSLKLHLYANWSEIKSAIENGTYRPQSVLGVEIDKPKGGKRLLGIPTA